MTHEEFAVYLPRYRGKIVAIARKLARRHDALMDDLEQEGMIGLLGVDLTTTHSNEDSKIRTAIRNRMIDFLRREKPALLESLDHRLEVGDQVALDECGMPRIIPNPALGRRDDARGGGSPAFGGRHTADEYERAARGRAAGDD